MSITYRALTLSNAGQPTNHSVTKPSGTVTGDTLIWFISVTSAHTLISIAPGFVLIPGSTVVSGTTTSYAYRKIALSDEPTSYIVSYSGSGNISTIMVSAYSDVLNPLDVDDIQTSINVSSTNRLFPSVTTTAANDLFLAYAYLGSNQTSTPDGLMTERSDASQAPKVYLMTQTVAGIGATDTRTATGTASTSGTVSMVLKEGTPLANGVLVTQAGLYAEAMPITQVNITQSGLYAEATPDALVDITQVGLYAEASYIPQVAVTQLGVYVETTFNPAFAGISAPTISAIDFSSNRIDITLGITATSYLGHLIETSANGTSGWTQIADLGIGVNTFSHTGLTPVTTYYYRARAYDAVNEGVNSSVTSDITRHPITLRSFTNATGAVIASDVDVATPAGVLEDDLMILGIFTDTIPPLPTLPAGWTLLDESLLSADNVRVYYKYATAAEPGTINIVFNTTVNAYVGILAYYSDDAERIVIDDYDSAFYTTSLNRQTPVTTPSVPYTTLISMLATSLNQVNTPQAGWTEYWDTGNAIHAYTATKQYTTTADTDTLVATGASNSTVNSVAVLLRRELNLPIIPLNVEAVVDAYNSVLIAWDEYDASNDGYVIERSLNGTTGWTEAGDVLQGVGIFDDTTVSYSTLYYYRVRGYIGVNLSSPSPVVSVTTNYPILVRASSVTSTLNATSVVINKPTGTLENDLMYLVVANLTHGITTPPVGWTLLTGNPGDVPDFGFQVYYKYATGVEPATYTIDLDGVPRSTIIGIVSLYSQDDQQLIIEDEAYDSYGASTNRNAPAVTSIEPMALQVAFIASETATTNTPVAGYTEVWDTIAFGSINLWFGTNELPTSETTPVIVATSAASATHESYSAALSIGAFVPPPDDPTLLTATTISDLTIRLDWVDNADNETAYVVERSLDTIDWTPIASLPADTVEYFSSGLLGDTLYYYRVKATNTGGSSGYSNVADATTDPTRIYYQYSNVANATTLPS